MSVKHDITPEQLTIRGHRLIHAGDDYTYKVTILRDGAVLDLSDPGAKLWMTIKEDPAVTDASAELQISTDDDIVLTDPANGVFSIKFLPDKTKNLEGLWDYDIKARLTATGPFLRLMSGVIEFLPNLTRTT